MQPSAGTFLLGVGAQKSGTSWLHHYLTQSPGFDSGITKEYHVWDALDLPLQRGNLVRRRADGMPLSGLRGIRHRMQTEEGYYARYFRGLCRNGATLTADITPSYAGLGQARFERIKAEIEATGLACKAIFIIRDPVERDKSAVRFNLARGNFREGLPPGTTEFCDALAAYSRSDHARMRSNYVPTIRSLRAAFPPEALHIAVYETLFERRSILALSDFLGIPARPDLARTRVNHGSGKAVTCPEVERKLQDHYREVYEFCAREVPETCHGWRA